jgi:hypothetical protein
MQNILSEFIFSTPQFRYRRNALRVALPPNLRQLMPNKVATYLAFIESVFPAGASRRSIFLMLSKPATHGAASIFPA